MLKLVLGLAGTGKTRLVLEEIRARAEAGKHSFLLVPEQFSATMEGLVYRTLGDKLSAQVTGCSFRTLGERILDAFGGGELPGMSDAGRAVLVRRALEALDPALISQFGRQKRSAAFCAACADAIQELKTAGVMAEFLGQAGADEPRLAQLALIYSAYEAQLANVALDPADKLSLAAKRLQPGFFAGSAVFLDGFDGFTAPQYEILQSILACGGDMTVTLCCPALHGGEEWFAPIQKTARQMVRIAERTGQSERRVQLLAEDKRHVPGDGPAVLAAALANGMPPETPVKSGVYAAGAAGAWQEAKYAAAILAKKAREGVRYARMAVVCREKDAYAAPLRRECRLAGVPLFEDEALTLQFGAPAAALRAAAGIAKRGLNTADILALLKTGLVAGALPGQAELLENYTLVWRMGAADWQAPLPETRTLDGFDGRENDAQAAWELAQAEAARAAVMRGLAPFAGATAPARTSRGMAGGEVCRAVYALLEELGAPEMAAKLAEAEQDAGRPDEAQQQRRMWDAAAGLLEELYRLLENEKVTAAEFGELLELMLRSTELGRIPQTLDAVLFTTADRMPLDEVEVCVVLGAGEGIFPRVVGSSGLLTHADRDRLKEAGAWLPGEFEQRVMQEELYFYRAAAAAKNETYFFWPENGEGKPAALLRRMQAVYPLPTAVPAEADLCATPDAAKDWLCGKGGQHQAGRLPGFADELARLEARGETPRYAIRDDAAMRKLLGRDMTVSPSRMERFYKCRLAYFLEYVARLKAPRPAKMDMRLGGDLIHHILEKALQAEEFEEGVRNLREEGEETAAARLETLRGLAERLAGEYIRGLAGGSAALSRREQNTVRRISTGVAPLLAWLQAEQAQSGFAPIAYEYELGPKGQAAGLSAPLPDGGRAFLVGKIDRVDEMREDEGRRWLRVVDYKTGGKEFSLDNVYYGLDAQMLLYLFSLCPPAGEHFEADKLPAGVLYLLADPKKKPTERAKAQSAAAPDYELHGLVADEEAVWLGMDGEGSGRYLPFGMKNGKAGRVPDSRSAAKRADEQKLVRICRHLEQKLQQMGTDLREGVIGTPPLTGDGMDPCDYCEYGDLCRRNGADEVQQIEKGAGRAFDAPDDEPGEE